MENIESAIRASGIEFTRVESTSPPTLLIENDDLGSFAELLKTDGALYFDHLANITGIDNGGEKNTIEVIYHFYSIPFNQLLAVKIVLPREKPEVESLCGLYKSANWFEREVFDMFGVVFTNHPDLRRILMPADWEGYPLRKDYQHQETYRDIQVKY